MIRGLPAAAFTALCLPAAALAQEATPLFETDAPLAMTIQGPLDSLAANRNSDQPRAATLSVNGQSLPISLAPRGITRRAFDICDFPPLRVDFPAGPGQAGTPFAGQRRLKLVTHCRRNENHQQHVLLEYAAYRLFNLLTPLSFRARLAVIDYRHPNGRQMVTRNGFFIEDVEELARRNGLGRARTGSRVPVSSLSPTETARAALFAYMIGNLDFSMRAGPDSDGCCHNFRLLQKPGTNTYIPVPYDFDFSGFVDAPYATPPAEIPVASVRVRRYRGYCIHNGQALAAAAHFRGKRSEAMAALAAIPGLNPATLSKASRYLDPFWAQVADDRTFQARVLKDCIR